jgi:hypothetical protein
MADPVFIVKFERGLADRHRLPLGDVISVLDEVRQMIMAVGRDFQKQRGDAEPTGDFGLELIAGRDGIVFRRGSVQAQVAITRDIQTGLQAATSVLQTVQKLGRVGARGSNLKLDDPIEQKIVRHLGKIATIQDRDKTELRLMIKPARSEGIVPQKTASALFGMTALQAVASARAPEFSTENVTLYGRLFELKDRNQEFDSGRFWGELRLDNGDVWRVQFDSTHHATVTNLFRKQVQITGRAFYYGVYPPKIIPAPDGISVDEERDYEAAFDELYGSARETLGGDFDDLLKEMHGE